MSTIGHVARQIGVQPSAIRYYEAQGIFKPAARQPNGYRIYNNAPVNLLLFVKRAQALGITLKEIKPLLKFGDSGSPTLQTCEGTRAQPPTRDQR
jgi:MerR family transcriptional regulator, copper efflux regulator